MLIYATKRNLKTPRTFQVIQNSQTAEMLESKSVTSRIWLFCFSPQISKRIPETLAGSEAVATEPSVSLFCKADCFASCDVNGEKIVLLFECKD